MKKIVSLIALCAITIVMTAGDLTGVRIYLNPGHGGWNGVNDRHIATIPFPEYVDGHVDTLGFWESSSNLKVAYDLYELLTEAGATVQMSRWTNQSGTRDNGTLDWDGKVIGEDKPSITNPNIGDRAFSLIKEEANAMNADMLLSIHSNAASSVGQAANYVACFLPGVQEDWAYQKGATSQKSVEYADKVYYYMYDNLLDCLHEGTQDDTKYWTFTKAYSLLTPGCNSPTVLCEASFHSYLPNTHRFLNRNYQTLEAYRFYYAICDIWKADFPTTAIVCGDVRSKNFKETRADMGSYIAKPTNHDMPKDKWKTMDNAKVELLQNGQVVQTTYTDNYCNGIYTFYDVQPGEYQVRVNAHHAVEEIIDITAVAGKTTTSNIYVTDSAYIRPLTPDFPNQAENATLAEKVVLEEYPIVPTPFLDGMNIRRMLTQGTKTYVLNDKSEIYVINTYTGQQISKLSTKGIDMTATLPLSDIALTSDSVLLACNKVSVAKSNPTTQMNVYKWDNDNADPTVLYSLQHAAGYTSAELGETMTVTGNIWWHKLFVSAVSEDSKRYITIFGIEYMSNDVETGIKQTKFMASRNTYTEAKWGSDFYLQVAPTEDDSYFIVDGANVEMTEYTFDWNATDRSALVKLNTLDADELPMASYGASFFQYAGTYYSIMPICDANGLNFGMQLYEIIENKALKLLVSLTTPRSDKMPQAGLNTSAVNFVHTAAVVEGDDLNLVMYLPQIGIARYSTRTYNAIENIEVENINWNIPVYDILGREVDKSYRGVVVQQGCKYRIID